MLRDGNANVEASWSGGSASGSSASRCAIEKHREIDRELRAIATKKCGLEVEEARWLREAERHRVWRKLGFSTALEYLEDVFGYSPRMSKDRLRVAKALAALTGLEAELRDGNMSYSAARELSRVMTPATEAQWLAAARGRNARDVQALVTGHKPGDTPADPKDPSLMFRDVVFRLPPRVDALLQQAQAMFERERGEHLDEVALMEALCMRALDGDGVGSKIAASDAGKQKAPKPAHQIVIRKCECNRAWQEGRGQLVEIKQSDVEMAECDCLISQAAELETAVANGTRRIQPTLKIPKKTRDFVWARDCGRCRFPGCRATRNLALHHLLFRMFGGDHDPRNLILLCDGHHKLLHDGIVTITGTAPDQLVFIRDGRRLIDPRSPVALGEVAALRELPASTAKPRSRFEGVVRFEQAREALKGLGFKATLAKQLLEEVLTRVGQDADVATIVETVLAMNRAMTPDDVAEDQGAATLAKRALVQSGYAPALAAAAVEAALTHVGPDKPMETLIMEAFRRCRDA